MQTAPRQRVQFFSTSLPRNPADKFKLILSFPTSCSNRSRNYAKSRFSNPCPSDPILSCRLVISQPTQAHTSPFILKYRERRRGRDWPLKTGDFSVCFNSVSPVNWTMRFSRLMHHASLYCGVRSISMHEHVCFLGHQRIALLIWLTPTGDFGPPSIYARCCSLIFWYAHRDDYWPRFVELWNNDEG